MIVGATMNQLWKWYGFTVHICGYLLWFTLNRSLQKLIDAIVEKVGRSALEDCAHIDISIELHLEEGESQKELPRLRVMFESP
jgi:hypothetical protein